MSRLLQARLSVDYPNKPGALRDVQIDVEEGEILGLVGESGSGKSTIALALLRLLEHKGASITGEILFDGRGLLQLRPKEMRQVRAASAAQSSANLRSVPDLLYARTWTGSAS